MIEEKRQRMPRPFDPVVPGYPKAVGGVVVENPVWLAPLAGITCASVRCFYRRLGAALTHTEMISALGLCYKGRRTKELLFGFDDERPIVLQIFGSNADDILRGAEVALNIRRFEALEVNMACPMPKVTKKGSGSKLMEKPEEAAAIVRALKMLGIPTWVKMRKVSSNSPFTTCDFCGILFEAGADFIFIHGRTAAQRYKGKACRETVGAAAARFPGLIGGSGDCYVPEDLLDYLNRGCAAVLAGRGILRDVMLIPRTLKILGAAPSEELCIKSPAFQAELLLELGRNIYNIEGEPFALMVTRRALASVFKGYPGATEIRRQGIRAKSWAEMERVFGTLTQSTE